MILKSVVRYTNAAAIEATWVEQVALPDIEVPASPALYDAEGGLVVPAVEAHVRTGETIEVVVRCHVYDATQMSELRADLGADAAAHEALIAQCEADYVPPDPPTPEEVRDGLQRQIESLEVSYLMPRVAREAFIYQAEERALQMGMTLEQLRAKNKGYAGLKSLDEQIAQLRSQMP